MEHQSYVLLCTETTVSNHLVVIPNQAGTSIYMQKSMARGIVLWVTWRIGNLIQIIIRISKSSNSLKDMQFHNRKYSRVWYHSIFVDSVLLLLSKKIDSDNWASPLRWYRIAREKKKAVTSDPRYKDNLLGFC